MSNLSSALPNRVALRDALRKKFPDGPRAALRALGLDDNLILGPDRRGRKRRPLLGYDSAPASLREALRELLGNTPVLRQALDLIVNESDEGALRVALEDLLTEHFGHHDQRVSDLLESLNAHGRDGYEGADRELIDSMVGRAQDFLRSRDLSEDDIDDFGRMYRDHIRDELADMPRRDTLGIPKNALDRRRRQMTRDVAFARRWPDASRIIEYGNTDYYGEPAVFAMDERETGRAEDFDERWPEAARIISAGGGN